MPELSSEAWLGAGRRASVLHWALAAPRPRSEQELTAYSRRKHSVSESGVMGQREAGGSLGERTAATFLRADRHRGGARKPAAAAASEKTQSLSQDRGLGGAGD